MPATGPNLAESGIDIMKRVAPIIADQQDHHAITPDEAIHQLQASSPQGTHATTVKKRSINVHSGTNNHMVKGKE